MGLKTNPSYEDVFGKTPVTDNKMYGVDKPKIVSEIEVEGGGGGGGEGQAFTRGIQFNAADYPAGTVITFDGFGFTPKKVMIQGNGAVGLGYFNSDGTKVDMTTTLTGESGHLMYLESGAALFTAFLLDFTDDGFRVTVGSQTDDFFYFYATCFSNI